MSELRWILIALGLALLAGIYWWGRRGSRGVSTQEAVRVRPEPSVNVPSEELEDIVEHEPQRHGRIEPTLDDMPTAELPVDDAAIVATRDVLPETPARPVLATPRRIERRKIIALRLAAGSQRYDGDRLRLNLQEESLEHGKYEVFHRLHDDGGVLFSVASMVEPGTFEIDRMDHVRYPGITLFAQLPGPVGGAETVDEIVGCAQRLQQSLGGTLQDERGVPLTAHRIDRLREEARDFEEIQIRGGERSSAGTSASP